MTPERKAFLDSIYDMHCATRLTPCRGGCGKQLWPQHGDICNDCTRAETLEVIGDAIFHLGEQLHRNRQAEAQIQRGIEELEAMFGGGL